MGKLGPKIYLGTKKWGNFVLACTSALMSLKLANLAGNRHKSSPPLTPFTPNPFIFMQKCYIYGYKPLCDLRCAY